MKNNFLYRNFYTFINPSKVCVNLLLSTVLVMPSIVGQESETYPNQHWSFAKPFGTFDKASLQRGLQVYKQVCAACHGLKFMSFGQLKGLGLSEDEIKAFAKEFTVKDGPNAEGEMFERPALASDYFPSPYVNPQQAKAANNGAAPPDLSLIVKARKGGANYLYAILTGYAPTPADLKLSETQHYNLYFPGHAIAMPSPLSDGLVTYNDGTKATVPQMAHDVVTFLSYVAEPEMEDRKRTGVKVLIYSAVLTLLLYVLMRKIWSPLKKK